MSSLPEWARHEEWTISRNGKAWCWNQGRNISCVSASAGCLEGASSALQTSLSLGPQSAIAKLQRPPWSITVHLLVPLVTSQYLNCLSTLWAQHRVFWSDYMGEQAKEQHWAGRGGEPGYSQLAENSGYSQLAENPGYSQLALTCSFCVLLRVIQGISPNVKIRVNPRNHETDISKISRALKHKREERGAWLSTLTGEVVTRIDQYLEWTQVKYNTRMWFSLENNLLLFFLLKNF